MWRRWCFAKATSKHCALFTPHFVPKRELHARSKKAMEFLLKGWHYKQEVDRVLPHAFNNDSRLFGDIRRAKRNFEMALEADSSNAHARYLLGKMHLDYYTPERSKIFGLALIKEAAEMSDPEAQYDMACRFRRGVVIVPDDEALYHLQKAGQMLHPGALYLLGAMYLTGDCVQKDVASAVWCFHKASEKGHAGAAIAYGSLLLQGIEVPERIRRLHLKRGSAGLDRVEMARKQFEIGAQAGSKLGLVWLRRLNEEEKHLQQQNLKAISSS